MEQFIQQLNCWMNKYRNIHVARESQDESCGTGTGVENALERRARPEVKREAKV